MSTQHNDSRCHEPPTPLCPHPMGVREADDPAMRASILRHEQAMRDYPCPACGADCWCADCARCGGWHIVGQVLR